MPVSVKSEVDGVSKKPEAKSWLVEMGAIVVGTGPGGLSGKALEGFAGRPVLEGAGLAWPPIAPLVINMLPKYQSKPKPLESSWETSTNLHLMLICGCAAIRTESICSMMSISCREAPTTRLAER